MINARALSVIVVVGMLTSCVNSDQKEKNTVTGGATLDTVPVFILKADTLKKVVELPLAIIEAPEVNTQYAAAASSIHAARSKWVASKDN